MNKIKLSAFLLACITLCACLPVIGGCNGWTLDYGTPAAQFDSRDAVAFAPDYLGKKVSVRGTVEVVDTSDPSNCIVKLRNGVTAHFPGWQAQANTCEVGKIAFIDGIVASATPDGVILKPCLFRDPDAPFDPLSK
jgi:hypothetical protein